MTFCSAHEGQFHSDEILLSLAPRTFSYNISSRLLFDGKHVHTPTHRTDHEKMYIEYKFCLLYAPVVIINIVVVVTTTTIIIIIIIIIIIMVYL